MNRFPLGCMLATPGAKAALERSGQSALEFFARHIRCDWGEVDQEDWRLNDEALERGERLLSAYRNRCGEKLWIITEADRSATTVLLPSEY